MAPKDGGDDVATLRAGSARTSHTGVATPPTERVVRGIASDEDEMFGCCMPLPHGKAKCTQAGAPPIFGADIVDDSEAGSLDLELWREDLRRLHGTIDQVVQSFIAGQSRQLDAVATELSSQKERIETKERAFTELSDCIAGFVEEEAKRLEACGLQLSDAGVDAQREAYDAELPGPPALHRINRLWRKATRAFESAGEAAGIDRDDALARQRALLEATASAAAQQTEVERKELEVILATVREELEHLRDDAGKREVAVEALEAEAKALKAKLAEATQEVGGTSDRLEHQQAAEKRREYEWDVEREELLHLRDEAQAQSESLEQVLAAARRREAELQRQVAERSEKLEQMRKVMDEQETEMSQKIERVQQYVKERQVGALHAEKKQQDAERMAERWQAEVRRLQADRDKLAQLVLELETTKSDQRRQLSGTQEHHMTEVTSLQAQLRRKEEEMRAANLELLQKREDEYSAKVSLERQREKDRSSILLRKKDQEVQIKDQQLRAARQKLQDLEGGGQAASPAAGSDQGSGSGSGVRRLSSGDKALPPLPLSAR